MATIRKNVREGVITGFIYDKPYGTTVVHKLAQIKIGDHIVYRVAEPRLWTEYDGLLEYRE